MKNITELKRERVKRVAISLKVSEYDYRFLKQYQISPTKLFNEALKDLKEKNKME